MFGHKANQLPPAKGYERRTEERENYAALITHAATILRHHSVCPHHHPNPEMIPPPQQSRYRSDIDGLRAIAVLAVVFYHASARTIPGGFVGVDVFFVISGFLITSILLRQMEEGTLSIGNFYERRIRRIMPALFTVIGVTLAAWFQFMMPSDFGQVAAEAKYAIISLSNIFFFRVTDDYFGNAVDQMPLLHTWSLGVEEQFYLGFPLLLMVAMRLKWSRHRITWLLGGLGMLSLGLCLWRIQVNASECFYLIPGRAWEMMVGSLLAVWAARQASQQMPETKWTSWRRNGLGLVGLAMIFGPMVFYKKNTLFPGAAALPPCLGTALVIGAGVGGGWTRKILSWKPLVGVGLISYSVYLWHWPMLAFQRTFYAARGENVSEMAQIAIGVASIPIGYFSWRLIEQPFRVGNQGRKKVFATWAIISAVFLVFVITAQKTNGFEERLPVKAKELLAGKKEMHAHWSAFFWKRPTVVEPVIYGDQTKSATTALWGDSHAAAVANEVGIVALEHGNSVEFYGWAANPPIVGLKDANSPYEQKKQNWTAGVMQRLKADKKIQRVVLAAAWWAYIGDPQKYTKSVQSTVAELRASGKKVFLLYPVPKVKCNVPDALIREVIAGHDPENLRMAHDGEKLKNEQFVAQVFDSLPDGNDLVRLRTKDFLVQDGNIRLMHDGDALYCDHQSHLTQKGAHLLRPLFEEIFNTPTAK